MDLWLLNNQLVTEVPTGYEAFVYKLLLSDGTYYIGKKHFFSTRRVKQEGKIRRKVVITESNWKAYTGSSKELNADLKAGHITIQSKEIIKLCKTKGSATWFELVELIKHNVLCDPQCRNKNILARFFKCYEE